jgi:DNA helicase HerA-like ATPase
MTRHANLNPVPELHFNAYDEGSAQSTRFAHIVSVSGCQAVAVLDAGSDGYADTRVEIGSLVKIPTPFSTVVGMVSGVSAPVPDGPGAGEGLRLAELNLAGEIAVDPRDGKLRFRRGVANFPTMRDAVYFADRHDLTHVYVPPGSEAIEVGALYQDPTVPACLLIDELLGKHFIIVGTTGCGKSSALAVILQCVLEEHEHARIVVLDTNNEYATAFGDKAEVINPGNLRLPFWLLNFQELASVIVSSDDDGDAEVSILNEGVQTAKRRYADAAAGGRGRRASDSGISAETPVPFRLADVVAYIDEQSGKLERLRGALPYRRLKSRIEALAGDTRYNFMFGGLMVEDNMGDLISRIFRIPANGKPITIIDLAAVPAEILDVSISLLSRLAIDLAAWSGGAVPTLLVCEDAHRYAPAASGGKYQPTRAALARIAKEGRKQGVSLALITQRPSELDPEILSRCSTAIAMRLSTERDQQVMRANTQDGTLDPLDSLPLLADREAIVLGQGVAMPMRIRFREMASGSVPHARQQPGFSKAWKAQGFDRKLLDETIRRWRGLSRR